MITIEINDSQHGATAIAERIKRGVTIVLADAGVAVAQISIAIVDDQTIWQLNRKYLQHDYATDVLSFLLSCDSEQLEGEIIVSAETAAREASEQHWPADHELLLYVVHGMLHLVGYDDGTDSERRAMRSREQEVLERLGIEVLENPREQVSSVGGGTSS